MKKKAIAVALLAAMALTGCGSKGSEGFTGEKVGKAENSKGDITIATVQFENGKAKSVEIDVEQADGTMKSEQSVSGAYDMKNEPGKKWHEQADLFEEAVVSNEFDLSKLNVVEGKTDAISGVTIAVKDFVSAIEDALNQTK